MAKRLEPSGESLGGRPAAARSQIDGSRRARPTPAFAKVNIRIERSGRIYQRIAAQMIRLIDEQGIDAGERLPPERQLALRLGVSRPSLREAMIALETAGVIEVRVGDGTYVRDVGSNEFAVATPFDPGPGLIEQLQARKLIEPHVAMLAAESITPDEIQMLQAAVDRAAARFAEGKPADEDDLLFHTTLARCSRNSFLAAAVQQLWELRRGHRGAMWRTFRRRTARPEHRLLALKERRAILSALRRRDGAAAKRSMLRLLRYVEQRLLH